jgi:hypothetical protein
VTKIGCQLTEQEQLLIVSLTTVGYRASSFKKRLTKNYIKILLKSRPCQKK